MELFFFLLINLVVFLAYNHGKTKPNILANMIIAFGLMGIAIDLFATGLIIPNQGITWVGNTATYLTSTFTTVNNSWIFGFFWMYLVTGFAVLGLSIARISERRVLSDGSIR